jgi:hypothetical protein
LGTDGGGGPLFNTQWNGSVTLDIEAILIANGIPIPPGTVDPDGGATKISIDLDDTLVAVSQQGTTSLISKKDFSARSVRANVPTEPGGDIERLPVPEPGTIALAGFAALGLLFAFRRRPRLYR